MRTYASSRVKRKSFYRKSELQLFLLISGGHICVPKLYSNMASPYTKLYNGAWNVLANNSETVGHMDLRLGKLFIYQSFVTFHFAASFTGRFPIISCTVLRDIENDLYHSWYRIAKKCHHFHRFCRWLHHYHSRGCHVQLYLMNLDSTSVISSCF